MFPCSSCNLDYKSSQLYLPAYMALTLEALSIPGVPGFMIFWLRLVIKVANVLSLSKTWTVSFLSICHFWVCTLSCVSFPLVWFFHSLPDILNLRCSFLKSPNLICILIFVWKDLNLLSNKDWKWREDFSNSLHIFVKFLLGVSSISTWF